MNDKKQAGRDGDEAVANLLQKAVDAFSRDAKEEFQRLVKAYEGSNAVVGIFGMGSVTIGVSGGKVRVGSAEKMGKTRFLGRGATYPETIVALAEGRMTPLEAFHTGDIVVRAPSDELHKAYGLAVQMSDAAIRSKNLQGVLREFRAKANV